MYKKQNDTNESNFKIKKSLDKILIFLYQKQSNTAQKTDRNEKVNIHFGKQRCSNERAKHYRIRLQSKERGREREEER